MFAMTQHNGPVGSLDALLAADITDLGEEATLSFLQAISAAQSRLDAARLAAVEHFSALRKHDGLVRRKLAAALKITSYNAEVDLELAHVLASRLPRTLAALAAGELNIGRVKQIERATRVLTDEQARFIEYRLYPAVLTKSPRQVTELMREKVNREAPEAAAKRAERRGTASEDTTSAAAASSSSSGTEGISRLGSLMSAEDVAAVQELVDSIAGNIKCGGDSRAMDQVRADVLRDLLLGEYPRRLTTQIHVAATAETLVGLSSRPGELCGYGPVPAELVRELAFDSGATWNVTEVDGAKRLCRLSRTGYRSSRKLATFMRLRDQPGRFPCHDGNSDHEHPIPRQRNAYACGEDCECPDRRRKDVKAHRRWAVETGKDGELIWTSPQNESYVSVPSEVSVPAGS